MADETVEKFYWRAPEDILALTHGGQLALNAIPEGIENLEDTPIDNQLAMIAKIRDADDRIVGTMSELEVFPRTRDTATFDVYLTIAIPGRGSLFVEQTKNAANDTVRALYEEVARTGAWAGNAPIINTAGPAPGAKGIVRSGTGDFEGMSGFQQQESKYLELAPGSAKAITCETFWLRR
jgi:hypothetical protein